jgi:hypothetical protein
MTNSPKIELKTGDFLFRGETGKGISEAIDQVTQTDAATHFSHVGLVKVSGDSIFVLHASTKGGTCKVSLSEFLHPEGDSTQVVAYRLKEPWQATIPVAIERAEKMLGKPYNFSYIISDSTHYCSEFIYRAFEPDSVFVLNPMTFKDPETVEFLPTWVEYYEKLGIDIPEGQPGCNPNGLASSDKLIRLGWVE